MDSFRTADNSPEVVLTTFLENSESIPDPKENLLAPGPGSCHRETIDRSKFSVK
jgi:hypothetical protein